MTNINEPFIAPADVSDPAVAEALAGTPMVEGQPSHLFATLAHHPAIAKRFNLFGGAFVARSTLPPEAREEIILRVSARTGAIYELAHHIEAARRLGYSDAQIRSCALAIDQSDDLLLKMTEELLEHDVVSEPTWLRLAERYNAPQLIELTLLVGSYRMLAGFLNSARIWPESNMPQEVLDFALGLIGEASK